MAAHQRAHALILRSHCLDQFPQLQHFIRCAVRQRRPHLAGAAADDGGARLHDAHRIAGAAIADAHVGNEKIFEQTVDSCVIAGIDGAVECQRGARDEIENRR